MSAEPRKKAARRKNETTRQAESATGRREARPHRHRLSAAEEDRLPAEEFAFPKERKEPLVDAGHVRNAVARFDQVQGVTDHERTQAWRRIQAAAKRFGVHIRANSWRQLFAGGKERRR